MNSIQVAVRGARGRMGQAALRAIRESQDLNCVVELQKGAPIAEQLTGVGAHVALDLTVPDALPEGVPALLRAGLDVVVGTSGVQDAWRQQWSELCDQLGRSCLIVPNFCIGVVLLQRFATVAARWFPDVELIEMHHERKVDHPSGTACDTARRIAQARAESGGRSVVAEDAERSTLVHGVPVHAVRLPGLLAHQLVIFGAPGEGLTMRHDTSDRTAFMPGVLQALRKVSGLGGLRVGLEHVLEGDEA